MTPELRERLVQVLREVEQRYIVQGTSENDDYSPPYTAPWYVIDISKAEPDVNWPGELIGQYGDSQDAYQSRCFCVLDAILSELTAAGYAVVPREANEEMRIAALNTHLPEPHETPLYEKVWQAMLKAAEET